MGYCTAITTATKTRMTAASGSGREERRQQHDSQDADGCKEGEEEGFQREFEIDDMSTIDQLNELSVAIGGPVFDGTYPVESARDELWDYVEGAAEDDVDEMCMGQLLGLLLELGGGELPDGATLQEATDMVRDLADKLPSTGGDG